MSARVFLDTNVLVYAFDRDAPEKRTIARRVLSGDHRPEDLTISTQVLQEFYVATTRKLASALPDAVALAAVRHLAELTVVPVDAPLVVRAIGLAQRHQVSLWDALIVQSAIEADCEVLLTEDLHASWVVGSLRVENPFA